MKSYEDYAHGKPIKEIKCRKCGSIQKYYIIHHILKVKCKKCGSEWGEELNWIKNFLRYIIIVSCIGSLVALGYIIWA